MGLRPRALIVSGDIALADSWASWLEYAGFEASYCPGPEVVPCPRLAGRPCRYRVAADVTVVDVAPETTTLYECELDRSCIKDPRDGGTIFVVNPAVEEDGGPRLRLDYPVTQARFMSRIRIAALRAGQRNPDARGQAAR